MATALIPSVNELAEWTLRGEYARVLDHIDATFGELNRLGDAVTPEERRLLYRVGLISAWRTGRHVKYETYKRRMAHLPRPRR